MGRRKSYNRGGKKKHLLTPLITARPLRYLLPNAPENMEPWVEPEPIARKPRGPIPEEPVEMRPEEPYQPPMPTKHSTIKMIGEGTYGKVYRPNLSCRDGSFDSDDNYISKLMRPDAALDEENVMKEVDSIDPHGVFHYQIVKKCQSPERYGDDELLIYENGGSELISYSYRLGMLEVRPTDPKKMFLGLWRLFCGLYVMHNNDYYHLDIKPANIVYKETPEETIIKYIDFGIAYRGRQIDLGEADVLFRSQYVFHPPETIYIPQSITTGRNFFDASVNARDQSLSSLTGGAMFAAGELSKVYESIASKMIKKLMAHPSNNWEKMNDKKFKDKQNIQVRSRAIYTRVDVFMLGTVIHILLSLLQDLPDQELAAKTRLLALAKAMSHPNIFQRIGPRKAFIEYIRTIQDVYGIDYMDKLQMADTMIPVDRYEKMVN